MIVERAATARERVSRAVNTELVLLYWSIGRAILTEQQRHAWGDDVVGLLARDLRAHGDLGRGFSRRNLFYMRQFAALWPDQEFVQPLAAQIGWSHHQVLLDAFGDTPGLYAWYAAKAVENPGRAVSSEDRSISSCTCAMARPPPITPARSAKSKAERPWP